MARTLLEDYHKTTESHFELAYHIPRRAREIQRRGNARVAEHDDKPIVIALREISERQSRFDPVEEMDMQEAAAVSSDFAAAAEAHLAEPESDVTPEPDLPPAPAPKSRTRAASSSARPAKPVRPTEPAAPVVAMDASVAGADPANMEVDLAAMGYASTDAAAAAAPAAQTADAAPAADGAAASDAAAPAPEADATDAASDSDKG